MAHCLITLLQTQVWKHLRTRRAHLTKHSRWQQAPGVHLWLGENNIREGLMSLQVDIKIRLATLQRTENLRELLSARRTNTFQDPFKFVKDLFEKEKSRILKTSRQELEKPGNRPLNSTWTLALLNGKRQKTRSGVQEQHLLQSLTEYHKNAPNVYSYAF